MEIVNLTWKEALVRATGNNLDEKEKGISHIFSVFRSLGIGKRVSHQVSAYSEEDFLIIGKMVELLKLLNRFTTLELRDSDTAKQLIENVVQSIKTNNPITLFCVFCPSYKKGIGVYGYMGKIGSWTTNMVRQYSLFLFNIRKIGIKVEAVVYFSDLLLENYSELIKDISTHRNSLKENFKSLCSEFDKFDNHLTIKMLSNEFGIDDFIDEKGAIGNDVVEEDDLFLRIFDRNKIFYLNELCWSEAMIADRTKTIIKSYRRLSIFFKQKFALPIFFWTESSFERGEIYKKVGEKEFIPIIYPIKNE